MMARSFLAAQIAEVRDGLKGLAGDLKNLGDVNSQVLSRSMGVLATGTGDGGSSGGGGRTQPGGPTILGPDGTPATPSPGYSRVGASSIAEFLRRLQEAKDSRMADIEVSGVGSGGRVTEALHTKPPTEQEKSMMKTLNEGVEYVRKLVAAARWAGFTVATVMRASKQERDALIAAYEEMQLKRVSSSTSTQGPQNSQAPWWDDPDKLGPEWTVRWGGSGGDPGFSGGGGGGSGFSPGGNGGVTGGAPQFNNNPFASKVAAVPTAGDRLVAETVGGVTKAIEKLAAKIDNQGNLAFRTKGL